MASDQRPEADPYRVLGLEPSASMAEVKRAYRLLAKAFHPDSAGEKALPRFLAIHEAYEQIRTGRVTLGGAGRARTPAAGSTAEPWRADPSRARAARERARTTSNPWRTGSAGSRGTTGSAGSAGGHRPAGATDPGGSTGSSGSPGASGASGGRSASSGSASAGAGAGAGAGARGRGTGSASTRRRDSRKATLGSTSYDDARDHNDATWSGASWYGPTTGEYWIVNPREYADPRKHGPHYQSRARAEAWAAGADAAGRTDASDRADHVDASDVGAQDTAGASAGSPNRDSGAARAEARSTAGTSTAWEADAPDAQAGAAPWPAGSPRRAWSAPPRAYGNVDSGSWDRADRAPAWTADRAGRGRRGGGSLPIGGRDWLAAPTDDPMRRLGLALVAWPPIGLAAAAAIGEVTGCATYSVACDPSDSLLPWLAQAAILGVLLLIPALARLFVGGTLAVLIALVPLTAFLLAVGGAGEPEAGFALAFLLAITWVAGVVWTALEWRRRAAREHP